MGEMVPGLVYTSDSQEADLTKTRDQFELSCLLLVHSPVSDSTNHYTYRLDMHPAALMKIRRPVINRNDQRASKERNHPPGHFSTLVAFDLIARVDGDIRLVLGHRQLYADGRNQKTVGGKGAAANRTQVYDGRKL